MCQTTPKWHWTLKCQRHPIYLLQLPQVQIPLRFAIQPAFSLDTGHFETSGPNDPKMTLNTKRLKMPHIHVCCITTPESRVSHFTPFRSTASLFPDKTILRQVHRMKPKFEISKFLLLRGLSQGILKEGLAKKEFNCRWSSFFQFSNKMKKKVRYLEFKNPKFWKRKNLLRKSVLRTTDGRLRHDSRSTDKVKQREEIWNPTAKPQRKKYMHMHM